MAWSENEGADDRLFRWLTVWAEHISLLTDLGGSLRFDPFRHPPHGPRAGRRGRLARDLQLTLAQDEIGGETGRDKVLLSAFLWER